MLIHMWLPTGLQQVEKGDWAIQRHSQILKAIKPNQFSLGPRLALPLSIFTVWDLTMNEVGANSPLEMWFKCDCQQVYNKSRRVIGQYNVIPKSNRSSRLALPLMNIIFSVWNTVPYLIKQTTQQSKSHSKTSERSNIKTNLALSWASPRKEWK
jgi:hypothetical protein